MAENTHKTYVPISESEQKYRALLDTTSAAIVLVSCDWKCIDFNESWCTFLGYSRNELLGMSPGDFTHPDDFKVSKTKHSSSAVGKGINYRIEKRYIKKNGETVWGDLSAKSVKNNQGEVVSIIATVVDITQRKFIEEQEKTSRNMLQALADNIPNYISFKDNKGCLQFVNKCFINWNALNQSNVFNQGSIDKHSLQKSSEYSEQELQCINNNAAISQEKYISFDDGQTRYVNNSCFPVRDEEQNFLGIGTINNDLTDIKRVQDTLLAQSEIINNMLEGVCMFRKDNLLLVYTNIAFNQLLKYDKDTILGQHIRVVSHIDRIQNHTDYETIINELLEKGYWQGDVKLSNSEGTEFWGQVNITSFHHPQFGDVWVAIGSDISDRVNAQEKLLKQAHFDTLTKLPNRFLTLDRLNQLIKDAKRQSHQVAVIFLDLDGFKNINDLFGHEIGDLLLKAASQRLLDSVRNGDTVGRLGGDEFLITLGRILNISEVLPVVNNVIKSFKDPFLIYHREIRITTSIGIALYPDDGGVVSDLLRNSDSAMYHAKQQGRNRYSYFTSLMNKSMTRRLEVEEQMQGALARNEFEVFYQPKVNVSDKSIMGAEALLRWHNPKLGNVAPDEFIPISEHIGLIIEIGTFVFKESLKAAAEFKKQNLIDFNMAINVSPLQFRDPNLINIIDENLQKNKFLAKDLELEITEGVLASVVDSVHETLVVLNSLGIKISMDDFGTGYSSLSYLRKYPFSVLKVDRSFINDIETDKADLELVNATISMAHALNLKVVAEGVETESQHIIIKRLGCDIAQGYLYSKAINKGAFLNILES